MNLNELKKSMADTTIAKKIDSKSKEIKEDLIRNNWLMIRQKLVGATSLSEANVTRVAAQVYPSMPLPFRLIVTENDFVDFSIRNFSMAADTHSEIDGPLDIVTLPEKLLVTEKVSKCSCHGENND